MLLAIDIGNTNIKYGVFDGDTLKASFRVSSRVTKTADEYGAVFVPFQSVLSAAAEKAGDPAKILGDGVHPTPRGHQLMADAWLKAAAGVL